MNRNKQHQSDCGCDQDKSKLLSADDALAYLTGSINAIDESQTVKLDEGLSRVLSNDMISKINVPGFDNSAMDGYAIYLKEEQINSPQDLVFEVVERIPAGSVGAELIPGYAAQIFTGAPIPKGANTVIMQEECELIDGGRKIQISRPLKLLENIRPVGNDIQIGDSVLKKGRQLKAQDIALLASVGVEELQVYRKIQVGIFFTGDEIVYPGEELKPGQIYNSNYYSLTAMLTKLHCNIISLGNIPDTFDETKQALVHLQDRCDLIITTGGVSVGEEDHVKPAVESIGNLDMWRIKIKPGKPLAYGQVGDAKFIGLPGNPVSAMVTFVMFAIPLIKKMQGLENFFNKVHKVQTDFDWYRSKPRREFVRVRLDNTQIPPMASQYPKQGSDVLSSMVWADGLLEIPENTTFKKGKVLNFYPLDRILS